MQSGVVACGTAGAVQYACRRGGKCTEDTKLANKELTYLLDDRETSLTLTTGLGWQHCKVTLQPPYREGVLPGVQFGIDLNWEEMEALRQYLGIAVKGAMRRDDIPERRQVQVPFQVGKAGLLVCMSPNDIENVTRHMKEIASYARSVALAGSVA